jgi:hypothetical protein
MMDESNKENFQQPNGMGRGRNLCKNTANMIRNRSSMSSDQD